MERVNRELIDHPNFRHQCAEVASRYETDERHVDEVLNGLVWAMSTNAEGFRVVPGLDMRAGFAFGRHPVHPVPALKVYFRIVDENSVELLWIEEDEGGYAYGGAF